jgi:hypothetical protein
MIMLGGRFGITFTLSLVKKMFLNKAYSEAETGDICLIQFLFRMVLNKEMPCHHCSSGMIKKKLLGRSE